MMAGRAIVDDHLPVQASISGSGSIPVSTHCALCAGWLHSSADRACCMRYGAMINHKLAACALKPSEQNMCVSMALDTCRFKMPADDISTPSVYLHDGTASLDLQDSRACSANVGQPLTVETDWLAPHKLPGDYHLFVPLLDKMQSRRASRCRSGGGTYPTVHGPLSRNGPKRSR